MSTRTVRLDADAEEDLRQIRRSTGLSISEALKRGLSILRTEVHRQSETAAWDTYAAMDLGPGGYAVAPSDSGREAIREVIAKRIAR